MVKLRPYQTGAVNGVFDYFQSHSGNPLIVLPTGAGKALTLAALCETVIRQYPDTRIMVLTHQKELIIQDARAILRYWPDAPLGIWSSGVGTKQKAQITVAGIQSVHKMPAKFGGTELVIVDECHLISKNADTMYGRFLSALKTHYPHLRVIGLTATPYRLDSGLLIEGEHRIFTDVAYEAHVGDLIREGYLCPLVAKNGATKADVSNLHTRGGEYIPAEVEAAFNHDELIEGALDEVAQYAHDRQHVIGFCAGVAHASRCAELARMRGWTADYVSGDMAAGERDAKLDDFTKGRIRFLFNANLLTTGFDYPGIDCLLLLRKTKSVGLYVQIMGRGLRNVFTPGYDLETSEGRLAAISNGEKPNCLVLDFGGNIEQHGAIDQIRIKRKREKGEDAISVAPVKECPTCHELLHTSIRLCPSCGYEFPASASHSTTASDGVIVAALEEPRWVKVDEVDYRKHEKFGKPPTVRVDYRCGIQTYSEYLPIEDERSFVRKHAVSWAWKRGITCPATVDEFLAMAEGERVPAPAGIRIKPDGRYWKVVDAHFEWEKAA